jgi:hypothetical protein
MKTLRLIGALTIFLLIIIGCKKEKLDDSIISLNTMEFKMNGDQVYYESESPQGAITVVDNTEGFLVGGNDFVSHLVGSLADVGFSVENDIVQELTYNQNSIGVGATFVYKPHGNTGDITSYQGHDDDGEWEIVIEKIDRSRKVVEGTFYHLNMQMRINGEIVSDGHQMTDGRFKVYFD